MLRDEELSVELLLPTHTVKYKKNSPSFPFPSCSKLMNHYSV